jgi:hypothetical protein
MRSIVIIFNSSSLSQYVAMVKISLVYQWQDLTSHRAAWGDLHHDSPFAGNGDGHSGFLMWQIDS